MCCIRSLSLSLTGESGLDGSEVPRLGVLVEVVRVVGEEPHRGSLEPGGQGMGEAQPMPQRCAPRAEGLLPKWEVLLPTFTTQVLAKDARLDGMVEVDDLKHVAQRRQASRP